MTLRITPGPDSIAEPPVSERIDTEVVQLEEELADLEQKAIEAETEALRERLLADLARLNFDRDRLSMINVHPLLTDFVVLAIIRAMDQKTRERYQSMLKEIIETVKPASNLIENDKRVLLAKLEQWSAW